MENERAVGPSTGSFHLEKTSLTEHSSAHNNTHPTFIKYRVKTKKIVHYISLFYCWSLDVIIWHQQDGLCRLYNQVWWQFPEDLRAETRTIYIFAVHHTTTTMAIKQTNSRRKSDKPNQININQITKMFATYGHQVTICVITEPPPRSLLLCWTMLNCSMSQVPSLTWRNVILLHSHITPPLHAKITMVKGKNCEAQAKG